MGRGRPKSIHPITTHAVRVTEATFQKLDIERRRFNPKEPRDRTVSRALDELAKTRKKLKASEEQNESLQYDLSQFKEANQNLLKIQKLQAATILRYENPELVEVIK